MPLQTDEEAMACARRGAAILDLMDPGWDRDIEPADVRLHDYCGCVLAHYGGGDHSTMGRGIIKLNERYRAIGSVPPSLTEMGFAVESGDCEHSLSYWYAPLQRAWEIIFAERRAARCE